MNTAEAVSAVKSKFTDGILNETQFRGETTLEVGKTSLVEILSFCKTNGFDVLMDLTAIDYLLPCPFTKVVYWLHNSFNFQRLRLTLNVVRNDPIPSVTSLWEGANWYERELFDMFGVHFEGHPDLKRILMPDDWKGHPMRRDYSLTEVPVEFKHDVKPKIPSEIIQYVKGNCK